MPRAIDIGFSDSCAPWKLKSPHFPSKLGGQPAWLEYVNFPQLTCEICQKQLIFLCQIYAPFEECPHNFHRTVFAFICKTPTCCIRNDARHVKIFRSNLPRQNQFYSVEPPLDKPIHLMTLKWVKLCNLCGSPAAKLCSQCRMVNYCNREHQIIDWKENHKHACGNMDYSLKRSKYMFPENEIVIEPEEFDKTAADEAKEMEKYEELKSSNNVGTLADLPENELEEHISPDNDKQFMKFKIRVSHNPAQVVRYDRGGTPLWIAKNPKPEKIPECEYCGAERQFEFQIMPQVLSFMDEEVIDFGILVVYTCRRSCYYEPGYKKEYVFKQDIDHEEGGSSDDGDDEDDEDDKNDVIVI